MISAYFADHLLPSRGDSVVFLGEEAVAPPLNQEWGTSVRWCERPFGHAPRAV